MTFAVDPLSICNDALLATGNQPISVISDGSDEWTAVWNFYNRALVKVLVAHDWKFALNIAAMVRIGSSSYPGYEDIYALPADCLLLRQAYDERDAALIQPVDARTVSDVGINLPGMDYRIIGNGVHCICPAGAYALYVQNPNANTSAFTVGFCEALRLEIETLLMRGFNEDLQGAAATKALAKEAMMDARQQDSSPEPRRIFFRSPMLERRRRRNNSVGTW